MSKTEKKGWHDPRDFMPTTKIERWEDNDGKGGKEKFWSDKSKLCLIECYEGIQTGVWNNKHKVWDNEYIGSLEHVKRWKYLEL